jgi:hypothetical protein
VARAKENLELRIILLEKAGEIFFQARFVAMHGLEDAHGRLEIAPSGSGGAESKAAHAQGNHHAVEGRGDDPKDSKRAQSER